MNNPIFEKIKEKIKAEGLPVHMETPYCDIWRSKHPNCFGCESEIGCKKYTSEVAKLTAKLLDMPESDWED